MLLFATFSFSSISSSCFSRLYTLSMTLLCFSTCFVSASSLFSMTACDTACCFSSFLVNSSIFVSVTACATSSLCSIFVFDFLFEKTTPKKANTAENAEAAAAIMNEYVALKRLESTPLCAQVPVAHGEVGGEGVWTWSGQSVLPKGKSTVRMKKEHYEFLDELKKVGLSHGDFAPWNCSIVGGKLHVWDWEDAGAWEDGKDEAWFKGQVKKLLGIEA